MRIAVASALLAASLSLSSPFASAQHAPALPAPLAEGHGRLRVAVNRPYVTVTLDGREAGIAPLERDLSVGAHTVRLTAPGFKPWQGPVAIVASTLTPLRASLRPEPDRTGAVVTVALAALAAGAGVAFGVASQFDRAALDADRAAGLLDNRDPRIDRGAVLAGVADGAFVLSGLVMALGIYLFTHDSSPPSTARTGRPHPLPASP
jgi:hypothetical protein